MSYRICYDDGLIIGRQTVRRTEYFRTEFEALKRARELLEEGDHHGIAVYDGAGAGLGGIRLELKLGMQPID